MCIVEKKQPRWLFGEDNTKYIFKKSKQFCFDFFCIKNCNKLFLMLRYKYKNNLEIEMDKKDREKIHNIFQSIKNGEKNKVEELFVEYNSLITNISFSIVKDKNIAEEVSQMVYLKIMQIDSDKLPENNEFSWLYTTTKNQTIDYLKKQHNNVDVDSIEVTDDKNKIDEVIDKDAFNNMLEGLDDIEKEIVSLKVLANLTFSEIGLMLNIPTGTVQWKYYKAINSLKIMLSNLAMFIVVLSLYINMSKNSRIEENEIEKENTVKPQESYNNIVSEHHSGNISLREALDSHSYDNATDSSGAAGLISTWENSLIKVSLFSLATIFLVISIIFGIIFIKRQQKRKHKSSK